jgi:hypothetical protein
MKIRDIEDLLNAEDDLPVKIKIVHKSKKQANDKNSFLNKKKTKHRQSDYRKNR